jgi:hypothetical protein
MIMVVQNWQAIKWLNIPYIKLVCKGKLPLHLIIHHAMNINDAAEVPF